MGVIPIITTDSSLRKMEEDRSLAIMSKVLGGLNSTLRKLLFRVISAGPIPQHMAFIMDGNRRFAKKWHLTEGGGHKSGFLSLMSILKYCYELGVKYVTVYAFSLDNFNRRPDEVQYVMNLMQEKIEGFLDELSLVHKYGVRVLFIGDLARLHEPVRVAAEKAMAATANNTRTYLLVCVAYTSSHEIPRAVYESCREKAPGEYRMVSGNGGDYELGIKVVDVDRHMYMAVAPEPDVLVRSSGETRLSNFLLWQTGNSLLYSPKALWPEMGMWEVVWGCWSFRGSLSIWRRRRRLD